jgi:hypothetical protein
MDFHDCFALRFTKIYQHKSIFIKFGKIKNSNYTAFRFCQSSVILKNNVSKKGSLWVHMTCSTNSISQPGLSNLSLTDSPYQQ